MAESSDISPHPVGESIKTRLRLRQLVRASRNRSPHKHNSPYSRGETAGRETTPAYNEVRPAPAMPPSAIQIEQLSQLDQFSTAVRLQKEIWGFHDVELLPRRLFVVATKIGGQLLGAFDGARMVAFCLCIPGLKPGGVPYLHSHMLGVLSEYRNSGLGRRMKLAQREYALASNIDLIEWTFDPLEIKNAFFNIERLGAIIRRYVYNQYGRTSSHLHGGLPTDRLIAEWWIRSPRVTAVLAKTEGAASTASVPEQIISVPAAIEQQRRDTPNLALQTQTRVSQQFSAAFGAGLAVTGFERSADAGSYLLQKWPSD